MDERACGCWHEQRKCMIINQLERVGTDSSNGLGVLIFQLLRDENGVVQDVQNDVLIHSGNAVLMNNSRLI